MKTDRSLSPLMEQVLYAREQRLLDDPTGQAILRLVDLGLAEGDEFAHEELDRRIRHHVVAQAKSGPFPLPHLQGDTHLGVDQRGRPVSVPSSHIHGHSLIMANTGAGKTVALLWLLLQLCWLAITWWWFDVAKREGSQKIPRLLRSRSNIRIISARGLRFNPLQAPSGIPPRDWASLCAQILAQALGLPPRAVILLTTALLRLFERFGVHDGATLWPTLFELHRDISSDRDANAPARQAILDRLRVVLDSLGRPVLGWRRGWTTRDLASASTIFNFAGIGPSEQHLLLASLIGHEFAARIHRGVSNPGDRERLLLFVDEAKSLIGTQSASEGFTGMFSVVRGTGISLLLGTQTSDIAPEVLSNCSFKLMGRCGSARDYSCMGSSMGLTAEQTRWAMTNLVPGRFIAQTSEGAWRHPFVLSVPHVDAPSSGSPSCESEAILGELESIHCVPDESPPTVISVPTQAPAAPPHRSTGGCGLSEDEVRFLRAVLDQPNRPSSTYAGLARMSPRKARAVRERLATVGLLRAHEVQTNARGRASIILEPTATALQALDQETESRGGTL